MKKMVLALGILGISSLGVPVTGLAAEANPSTSMTSEASLTINPGILSLDSVSNFDFGTGNIADFAQQEKVITTVSNSWSKHSWLAINSKIIKNLECRSKRISKCKDYTKRYRNSRRCSFISKC